MTTDDMASELRAAGWERHHSGRWVRPGDMLTLRAGDAWKELAQQRERGTVTTPLEGQEDARDE